MRAFLAACAVIVAASLSWPGQSFSQGQMPACKASWKGFGESQGMVIMNMTVKPNERCIYSIRMRRDSRVNQARMHKKPTNGRIERLKASHFVYAAPAAGKDQFIILHDGERRRRAATMAIIYNVTVR